MEMSWTREDSGCYTRKLCDREYLTQLIGSPFRSSKGLEDWLIYAAVVVDKPLSASEYQLLQYRNAWQQLRFEHPGIAVELTNDGKGMMYRPCTLQNERASWLEQSFFVDEAATSTNEVYGALTARPSSYLCVAPKAQAIIFCIQHWHADGRGAHYLLGRLLNILNAGPKDPEGLPWGAEEERLPSSFDFLAHISPDDAPNDKSEVKQAARAFLMMESVRGLKVQGDLSAECQAPQLQVLALSNARSNAIMEACRQKGISVTSIFHAAACLENIKHGNEGLDRPFVANVRRDLRAFLEEPFSRIEKTADRHMVSNSYTKIDRRLSLLDFAHALQHHYKNDYSEEYFRAHDAALCAEVVQVMLSGGLVGLEPALEIQFSSLGKLDESIPKALQVDGGEVVRVREVEFGLTVYAPGMGAMWLYSFDGQIYMSIAYNTAYRTAEAVLEFLSALEDAVVKALLV